MPHAQTSATRWCRLMSRTLSRPARVAPRDGRFSADVEGGRRALAVPLLDHLVRRTPKGAILQHLHHVARRPSDLLKEMVAVPDVRGPQALMAPDE
jgi:hypothetical protein